MIEPVYRSGSRVLYFFIWACSNRRNFKFYFLEMFKRCPSTRETAWILETQKTAYVLGLHPTDRLVHRYWGPKLPYVDDYPGDRIGDKLIIGPYVMAEFPFNGLDTLLQEEYPTGVGIKFVEPCLKMSFSDGARDTRLQFERAEVVSAKVPELQIHLRETYYPLKVVLHYRVWEE